ncbi:MAG: Gfo/Idh/MocA family oxidoreductase [Oscillospiraceae bacterium]|jgi:predicted dehydrogenase|nr:Gfo/Idh/MocA family oxidoreductase [uncultured Oscillibacter sp.]MCI9391672.1 Gfo/Idh/MocA family oxidoreductase [Oscillospiraceae bacterium]
MQQLRIGVIGVGNMGRNHVRILSEEERCFHLAGVYDADGARAQKIAEQFGTTAFQEMEPLLQAVEAVVIAVPSSLHRAVGLLAAAHGVHALIEKPLAMSAGDAQALCRAFAASGKILTAGHVERFNPVYTELSKLLMHEQIIAIEARRYSPFDGRIKDANVVEDLMIHDLDLVCHLMEGHAAVRQSAFGQAVHSRRLDFAHCALRFDNGVQASVSASRVTQGKIRELSVHTRGGFITADLLAKTLQVSRSTNMVIDEGQEHSYRQESVTEKIFVPMIEPLRAELIAFYDAVVNGRPVRVDGQTAARMIALCERITQQAESACSE